MLDRFDIFRNYFDSNRHLLKISGVWIYNQPVPKLTKYLQYSYNIIIIIYIFIAYLPFELLFVIWALDDLDLFLRSLRDIGNHVTCVYKFVNYYLSRRKLIQLIDLLENYSCNYENVDDYHPNEIVDRHKDEAKRWSNYFWNVVNSICFTMFTSGLLVFVFFGDQQWNIENGERVYRQQYPVNIVSPFGKDTRQQFLITFLFTVIALTLFAWMIIALDSLFITLMSCISAHLEVLQGAFRTLRARCLIRLGRDINEQVLHDPDNVQNEMLKEINICIKHLQTIFSVAEDLEAIYNVQTLFQTLVSLGEMCFSLYLLSQVLDANTGNELFYLLSVAFELLLYCWFGNGITEASTNLSFAIYDSDWYPMNPKLKKQMIITFTRLTKPIFITIGKVTPLTFSTFLTMARGAYSFFTFLKQRDGIKK